MCSPAWHEHFQNFWDSNLWLAELSRLLKAPQPLYGRGEHLSDSEGSCLAAQRTLNALQLFPGVTFSPHVGSSTGASIWLHEILSSMPI